MFYSVLKYNPNHDKAGRFAKASGVRMAEGLTPSGTEPASWDEMYMEGRMPKKGDSFAVLRMSDGKNPTLENRNAGNIEGVSSHFRNQRENVSDEELAAAKLSYFLVTLTKDMADYQHMNGSVPTGVGNQPTVDTVGRDYYFSGLGYSFGKEGQGYTSKLLHQFEVSDLYKDNPDELRYNLYDKLPPILAAALKPAKKAKKEDSVIITPTGLSHVFKFNPNHDKSTGRFTSHGGSGGRAAEVPGAAGFAERKNKRTMDTDRLISLALKGDKGLIAEFHATNAKVIAAVKAGKETYRAHVENLDDLDAKTSTRARYTPERLELHRSIVAEFLKDSEKYAAAEGENPTVVLLGGRGGSGKGNFDKAKGHASGVYDATRQLVLDPDRVKDMMPEYDPEYAYLSHRESSDIFDKVVNAARRNRLNVVLDSTMRNTIEPVVKRFKKHGYEMEAHYMHLSPEASAARALGRWANGGGTNKRGRLVPPDVVLGMVNNEKNFDKLQKYTKTWSVWANDRPIDVGPRPIASSEKGVIARKMEAGFYFVLKRNPYHDEKGRFASHGGAMFVSSWGKQYANIDNKGNSGKNLTAATVQIDKVKSHAEALGVLVHAEGLSPKAQALADKVMLHAAGVTGYTKHVNFFSEADRKTVENTIRDSIDEASALSVEEKQALGLPLSTHQQADIEAVAAANLKTQNHQKAEAAVFKVEGAMSDYLGKANIYGTDSPEAIASLNTLMEADAEVLKYGTEEQQLAASAGKAAAASHHEYQSTKAATELAGLHAEVHKLNNSDKATFSEKDAALQQVSAFKVALAKYLHPDAIPEAVTKGNEIYQIQKKDATNILAQSYADYQKFKVNKGAGETWEDVAAKTGVSVPEIKATYVNYQAAYKSAEGFHTDVAKAGISEGKAIYAAKQTTNETPVLSMAAAAKASTAAAAAVTMGLPEGHPISQSHLASVDAPTTTGFVENHIKLGYNYAHVKQALGADHPVTKALEQSLQLSAAAGIAKHGYTPELLEGMNESSSKMLKGTTLTLGFASSLNQSLNAYAGKTGAQADVQAAKTFAKYAVTSGVITGHEFNAGNDLMEAGLNSLLDTAIASSYTAPATTPAPAKTPLAAALAPKPKKVSAATLAKNTLAATKHLDTLPQVPVQVSELPVIKGAEGMKTPATKDDAMAVAKAMGTQFYVMQKAANQVGAPEHLQEQVTKAYGMYAKAKAHYVEKGGQLTEFGSISNTLKQAVNAENGVFKAAKAEAKAAHLAGLKKAGENMAKLADTKKGDSQKVSEAISAHTNSLVKQGLMTHQESIDAVGAGITKYTVAKKKAVDTATTNLKAAAAHLQYQKLKNDGDMSHPDVVAAANKLTAVEKTSKKNLTSAEMTTAKTSGAASGEQNHASGKAFEAKFGQASNLAADYDTRSFKAANQGSPMHTKEVENAYQVWGTFDSNTKQAFKDYTNSGFSTANQSLTTGAVSTSTYGLKAKENNRLMTEALKGKSLSHDLQLRRNMPQKWFWKALGLPHGTRQEMWNLTQDDLDSVVGKTYTEAGFSSTTYNNNSGIMISNTGSASGGMQMNIRAGKGVAEAFFIDGFSSNSSEKEVILQRGATYVIKGIRRKLNASINDTFPYEVDLDLIGHFYKE